MVRALRIFFVVLALLRNFFFRHRPFTLAAFPPSIECEGLQNDVPCQLSRRTNVLPCSQVDDHQNFKLRGFCLRYSCVGLYTEYTPSNCYFRASTCTKSSILLCLYEMTGASTYNSTYDGLMPESMSRHLIGSQPLRHLRWNSDRFRLYLKSESRNH